MKILQLIDTLNPGGAERMAVNYANSLNEFGQESFLISTREEGSFKFLLNKDVKYAFLKRRRTFDFKAIKFFIKYLDQHAIDIVHAHGTSWFFTILCKMAGGKFKLIWHNHYGASRKLSFYKKIILASFSRYFDGVISVNADLKEWAETSLKCSKSIMLDNFVIGYRKLNKGSGNSLNIVCLANLKTVKNHMLLLNACDILINDLDLRLHLIGKDFNDEYSNELKAEFKKRSYVQFYGSVIDPFPILNKTSLGVLSSKSEGMPMALLEYGAAGLAVISTDVGASRQLLNDYGKIVSSDDPKEFSDAIKEYCIYPELALNDSRKFRELVLNKYSDKAVIPKYLNFCKTL
jgi:glycosyltransferase involved in cell wall biosynthesis